MRYHSIREDEHGVVGTRRCPVHRWLHPGVLFMLAVALAASGCSLRQYTLDRASDALAGTGKSFASDDDPELIAEATPFGLKLMDSLLEQNPEHIGLLTAAAKGYTQYAFAFVQQDGEMLEDTDIASATEQLARARRLYARARTYALRGLDAAHPGMSAALAKGAKDAVKPARKADVPLLYWSAAATGAWIGLSKDSPAAVSQVPSVEAEIDRALALDEAWDAGAIHTFLISYELNRAQRNGDPVARARAHFHRAVELSEGQQAAPYVALAESVCVSVQDRAEFERTLKQALAIDVNARPQWRLANVVMQQRAHWLLSRTDQLFAE